jgi:hypothetical protein
MSIFDITPAGAYVNAIQAANARDRREAAERPARDRRAARASRFLVAANALLRVVTASKSLRPAAELHSRTA